MAQICSVPLAPSQAGRGAARAAGLWRKSFVLFAARLELSCFPCRCKGGSESHRQGPAAEAALESSTPVRGLGTMPDGQPSLHASHRALPGGATARHQPRASTSSDRVGSGL